MKSLIHISMASMVLALGACQDKKPAEPETVVQDGSPVCPPEQVLADISTYSNEVADPTLSEAEWFAENGKKKGVHTTPSGLQYRINKSGPKNGPNPLPTNTVRVNYHGQFFDGKTFDSSYRRHKDIEFPLNRVIKGWTEGVGLMKPCDAWTFYIPSDLAYGPGGKGPIPPATPLMFHVQLIEIK
ncbi:MAG TPA: FKBP-type peptidyl-prolyl cis-trans isomerase [Hellea balneolensis]|uniref:Peptidyl-prolyl cis-trans isomerase n=1 Tax=Hellea balneolensis TaxID=287478 RepID=A0A7C5QNI6_9PROT|nr:FKBP-type peptidyl-prolyl cis-trans isomerase [Hellea balneolensis]